MDDFWKILQVLSDMLRKSEAKAVVTHRSAPQRHRRTPSVLTKRVPAPSPDRALSMSKNDDELNELFYSEFIDEVTDTACLVSK
jgi:hypothetical protein